MVYLVSFLRLSLYYWKFVVKNIFCFIIYLLIFLMKLKEFLIHTNNSFSSIYFRSAKIYSRKMHKFCDWANPWKFLAMKDAIFKKHGFYLVFIFRKHGLYLVSISLLFIDLSSHHWIWQSSWVSLISREKILWKSLEMLLSSVIWRCLKSINFLGLCLWPYCLQFSF